MWTEDERVKINPQENYVFFSVFVKFSTLVFVSLWCFRWLKNHTNDFKRVGKVESSFLLMTSVSKLIVHHFVWFHWSTGNDCAEKKMAYKCRTLNIQEKESPFVWISMDNHKYHRPFLPSTLMAFPVPLLRPSHTFIRPHHNITYTSLPLPSSIHLDNDGSTFHPILHLKRDNTQVLLALGWLELMLLLSCVCVCCSWCYINFGLGGWNLFWYLSFVFFTFQHFLPISTAAGETLALHYFFKTISEAILRRVTVEWFEKKGY